MPLYIPWLTEAIKKRGVRYLLQHYLGQFFEEKLTLEQLSIDIYEGKGSITNLALDVNGLNDELDFVPFRFLEGCLIEQISVEVPWVSLVTEACKVELLGAKFICRLKTPADSIKGHCNESTLLSRSLMTSSLQMAEDIVTRDDEDCSSNTSSIYAQQHGHEPCKRKDVSQIFEGLEMFAQLIDSVLRRTKLTAHNTLFQIKSQASLSNEGENCGASNDDNHLNFSSTSFKSDNQSDTHSDTLKQDTSPSEETVEFFIRFFRCEEVIEQREDELMNNTKSAKEKGGHNDGGSSITPETVVKLLTLEDVEMRIGGVPVSNIIGKHTIMIKFNELKSEISVFCGSPFLAVISQQQLKTFFEVFKSKKDQDSESSLFKENTQKIMNSEDYAKIENQLMKEAYQGGETSYLSNLVDSSFQKGKSWMEKDVSYLENDLHRDQENEFYSPNCSSSKVNLEDRLNETNHRPKNIEVFTCELKLPGIWLCVLEDGQVLPPLIEPFADSINQITSINSYIDQYIKIPHIRILALKVALDITKEGICIFLGDLDISEKLDNNSLNSSLHLLQNDQADVPLDVPRYKISIFNNKEIMVELLSKARITFDPTIVDRLIYDYKIISLDRTEEELNQNHTKNSISQLGYRLDIQGKQLRIELLCPIPDLSLGASDKITQLRPQSFLIDFYNVVAAWSCSGELNICADQLRMFVKTQPQQNDSEATKIIEATGKNADPIIITLETMPSNLDTALSTDVEQVLSESSLYDSIYVGQNIESQIPKDAFQIKRKVVRGATTVPRTTKTKGYDSERILTPGDRQHLTDYLNQTLMFTKLSLNLHLPTCEIEFEDKQQLDLIYNRLANDFVFWQPKAFSRRQNSFAEDGKRATKKKLSPMKPSEFFAYESSKDSSSNGSDEDSEILYHSLSINGSSSEYYDNEMTCKITVGEASVRLNHQSCLVNMKQEVSTKNLLLGVVIDLNKNPCTILSMVSDNLELCTDSKTMLGDNIFNEKISTFSLAAEIKRTSTLKDIKLAIQLVNGLFIDFKTDTYNRFWQSISVTDEPIIGFCAPKVVIELHINILSTAMSLVREGARPALLSMDDVYLNSVFMEKTSQVMVRLIADEVSLYLKRNRKGPQVLKNYICLIDSGLIDLDIKISLDGHLEFKLINNLINVRVCQDSMNEIFRLFNVILKSSTTSEKLDDSVSTSETEVNLSSEKPRPDGYNSQIHKDITHSIATADKAENQLNLLEDAMNDYIDSSTGVYNERNVVSECTSFAEERNLSSNLHPIDRNLNGCLLDESNPTINSLFSQPLLSTCEDKVSISESYLSTNKSINESGFFVIGDDDVGAGIIDKLQNEPVVRKLVDKPITVIENYIKMTKPRTLPEKLVQSLERYLLEEMTLVLSLYGGKDFDDERVEEDSSRMRFKADDLDSDSPKEKNDSFSRCRENAANSTKKSCLIGKNSPNDSIRKKGNRKKHLSEGSRDIYKETRTIESGRVRFGEGAVNLWESLDLLSAPDSTGSSATNKQRLSADIKKSGGYWRQSDVCIQLTLNKVKLLYELGDIGSPISWRFLLFIQDIEVKDEIHASDINKMLYEYSTESMPKRSAQMLTIQNIATINSSDGCEECDLSVSIKPLRLNIDQDTLLFLIDFFTSLSKSLTTQDSVYSPNTKATSSSADKTTSIPKEVKVRDFSSNFRAATKTDGKDTQAPLAKEEDISSSAPDAETRSSSGGERRRRWSKRSNSSNSSFSLTDSLSESSLDCRSSSNNISSPKDPTPATYQEQATSVSSALPTHCHTEGTSSKINRQPIYIKSFTFSPDVPIRLDYHAKHLDFEQGALAGILMGLAHLDHSELVLRRVEAIHGMRGLDRVILFAINFWMSDIKRNQLPSILSGVGPMHSVIQLIQGIRDLIWMPIDHYRKDKRLVRGIQRGASSFSSSTAMAAINLVNRFISIVQCTAQIAHDIVTPPTQQSSNYHRFRSSNSVNSRESGSNSVSNTSHSSTNVVRRRRLAGSSCPNSSSISTLNQPRNFCEGVAVGYTIIKEGFNDTARNVAVGMQAEDVRTVMGELVRQIPSTLLNPIISATEGAQNVLVGIRNQIAPDARREDQEKWKRRVRGK